MNSDTPTDGPIADCPSKDNLERIPFGYAFDCYVRPGTRDKTRIESVPRDYGGIRIQAGSTVFDCGANIGIFSRWALARGAGHIVAYEPEPENFALLQLNTAGRSVECINAAVCGEYGSMPLYIGASNGIHSLQKIRNRDSLEVATVDLAAEIERDKPAAIKVDIEGGEYLTPALYDLPRFVRAVAIEIHLTKSEWREFAAMELIQSFKAQGFQINRCNNITPGAWQIIGLFLR
jgi:FkbM family methyltransferase